MATARPVLIPIRRCRSPYVRSDNGCFDVDDIANHGLHVSGTIGATNDPANNVTGVNFNVRIRMVRALGIDGFGYDFDIAQAVLYAAGLPAEVGRRSGDRAECAPIINMSLGGTLTIRRWSGCRGCDLAGSVIIASLGNDASFMPTFRRRIPT